MKYIFIFLFVSAIISCNTSKKALQKGNYNDAFYKSVKKLQKKPNDQNQAEIFTISYQRANQQDLDKISFLKMSGEKNIWDDIYKRYTILSNRQKAAETVLPLRVGGKTTKFKHIDYSSSIIESKRNAAEFHYNKGKELLKGDKLSIRNAYNHFAKVKTYTNNYSDVDKLMTKAIEKGTTHVLIKSYNKVDKYIDPKYIFNLIDFGMPDLDKNWVKYYNKKGKRNYDYNISISIENIYIGPDQLKENKELIKKEVEDGWKYELDNNGNVKKDSLGNDIKVPKYKTISCNLISKVQRKTATIEINVGYQNNSSKRMVVTTPLNEKSEFQYTSSFANGDLNALDEKTRNNIGKGLIRFPTEAGMIKNLTDKLKIKVKNEIKSNSFRIK